MEVVNDDTSTMGAQQLMGPPPPSPTPISYPHMIDEINNEDPLDTFPDGFPDKTLMAMPNQIKSYAYSYASTARPIVSGVFKWKNGIPADAAPYSASGEVIDTENCSFKLPKLSLIDNVTYPPTAATKTLLIYGSPARIVTTRKIQAYLTFNRKVERKNNQGEDKAASLKPIKIRCTVYDKTGTPVGWSDSFHTIYVTWDTPSTLLRQETLFNLSCVMANKDVVNADDSGKSVFDKVWSDFTDREVKRMDDSDLQYYGSYLTVFASTEDLLSKKDGICDSWVKFLVDCGRV